MEYRIEDEGRRHWLRLYDGTQKAAELQVIDYEMYLGGIPISTGGIADVHTEAPHRGRGLMRSLFGHLDGYLRQRGFALSLLFGIPDFYDRFGYATALARSEVHFPTRHAERARPLLRSREATPDDIPALAELYQSDCAGRSGPLMRQEEGWKRVFEGWSWTVAPQHCVVHDGGTIRGYAFWRPDRRRCFVSEIMAADLVALESLVAVLAREAIERRVARVQLSVPADHPVAMLARRLGGVAKVTFPHGEEGMLRVLDLATVLDRLGPRLAARLRSARQGQEVSRLVISPGEREAAVSLGNGRGQILRLVTPLSVAGQLLMGFRDVEEAVAAGDAEVEPAHLPTCKALLPAGYPFCWLHDQF